MWHIGILAYSIWFHVLIFIFLLIGWWLLVGWLLDCSCEAIVSWINIIAAYRSGVSLPVIWLCLVEHLQKWCLQRVCQQGWRWLWKVERQSTQILVKKSVTSLWFLTKFLILGSKRFVDVTERCRVGCRDLSLKGYPMFTLWYSFQYVIVTDVTVQ